jgi:hypothetical protein
MKATSTLRSAVAPLQNFSLTMVALLGVSFGVQGDPVVSNMPQDAELAAVFRSHRDSFEKLAAMGMEDYGSVSLLSKDLLSQRPLTGGLEDLTPQRRDEYLRLLTSIKPALVMGIDFYRISFSFRIGLSIGPSWMKGISYLPHGSERVGTIVRNLDQVPDGDHVYLVPIEATWYIIYVASD